MKISALESILAALEEGQVRYLVAGGVAVNIHGYQRLTRDLDLVVHLEKENVERALAVLGELGFTPVLPVPPEAFAGADTREQWRRERNLEVFSLTSEGYPGLAVDLLAQEPFPFERERQRAAVVELRAELSVPVVALDTLIAMKERTDRPRDRDDVQHLRWILEGGTGE